MTTLNQYLNYQPSNYVSGKVDLEIKITNSLRPLLPARYRHAVEIFISGYEITWKMNHVTSQYEFCFVSPMSRCFTGVIYNVDAGDWERQDIRDENDLINSFKRMMMDKAFADSIFDQNRDVWSDC
jgi:hypothetical protein